MNLDHNSGDIQHAYSHAIAYTRHLKEDSPYLFSLCHLIIPFYPEAKAEMD